MADVKLNQNLINILEKIMSEKQLAGKVQDYEKELAELQCQFFAKKIPSPQEEQIKKDINERFEKIRNKGNEELKTLMDVERCRIILEEVYGVKNNKNNNSKSASDRVFEFFKKKLKIK